MNIAVLRETQAEEARVALVPESVRKLTALKVSVSVESGAGLQAPWRAETACVRFFGKNPSWHARSAGLRALILIFDWVHFVLS